MMYHNRQHKIHSDWSGRFACVVLKTIGAPVFCKTPADLDQPDNKYIYSALNVDAGENLQRKCLKE